MKNRGSPKLRILVTLHALFKHTDEKHRLNAIKLNEFLRPYELDCNKKILWDTAEKLKEFGIELDIGGGGPYKGICLANRPLPDHELQRLIFAVETNPYIRQERAQELIAALKPAVTVFQEPMLHSIIKDYSGASAGHKPRAVLETTVYESYCMIHDAMARKHRVCCSRRRLEADGKSRKLVKHKNREETYLPGHLVEYNDTFYMVGYNHSRQRVEAVDMKNICSIRPAQYNALPEVPELLKMLERLDPMEYVPKEEVVIYEGPAVFYCASKCLQSVHERFGEPGGPVERDERSRYTYPVSRATISSETLCWLGDIPGQGIRIIGPEPLLEAVRAYYCRAKTALL